MHNLTPAFILEKPQHGNNSGRFDAVVLFIDTSGFTPLTVRLTEHGRDGAEVLADILHAVFEPLVAAVYAHGGFIAGFAGDAFKAVFPGISADSYLHALTAAEQIRTHMAANPSHQTRYGTFDFSVRMSIADGSVTWSIWSSEEEKAVTAAAQTSGYTFSGTAIEQAIQGEDHADGSELIVTQSVADALLLAQPGVVAGQALTGEAAGYMRITQFAGALPAVQSVADEELAAHENNTVDNSTVDNSTVDNSTVDNSTVTAASDFYPASLLTTQTRGEFRPVYTLFINVQRLPSPGEDDDFLPYFFWLLHQYGGYLCRIGRIGASDPGGTFLLFWGAPSSHENGLERVLSFVLELQANITMPLRAGITHAVVYAGFVGSQLREEYTCHGNSVNQAARQMTTATWDQILLDAETARRAQDGFEVTLAGHYALKGLAEEQPLFTLTGQQTQSAEHFYQADFVGRDNELTQLQRAIQPIFSGTRAGVDAGTRTGIFGGITLVIGEAGIGKSRLVHEFLMMTDALENVQIVVGQVDEILRESLNPFRYFLRRYFEQSPAAGEATNKERFDAILGTLVTSTTNEVLSTELTRTRSFLGALVNLHWPDSLYAQLEPQLRYENTLVALKTLIQAESLRQPLILLLEDGQWLDAESLAFLERLTRNVDDFPFGVLVTARPAENETLGDKTLDQDALGDKVLDDKAVPTTLVKLAQETILVAALSEADLAELARDQLGTPASTELAQLLTARAEGNPFFTEQMLLYLQEQDLLVEGAGGWQLTSDAAGSENVLPADLQTVLVARLDRLTQEVKQVVQTAAVLGREFSVQVLSQMLRDELAITDMVKSAEASAVWNSLSELRYLFRHALLRDAAYDMQLRARLRSLHQTAAQAIETLYTDNLATMYADLVYHYQMAELSTHEREYAWLAAIQAEERYENRAAINYLNRVIDLTLEGDLVERYKLERMRTRLHHILGERDKQEEGLAVLAQLTNQLDDHSYRAEVAQDKANFAMAVSDYDAMIAAAQQIITHAEDDPTLLANGYISWGNALSWQGKYDSAQEQLEQALHLVRNTATVQEADSYNYLGLVELYRGAYDQCQQYQEHALTLYRALERPINQGHCLNIIGLSIRHQGDSERAMTIVQEALTVWQEVGYRRGVLIANGNLGHGHLDRGNYRAAQRNYEYVGQIARDIRDTYHVATALHNIGLMIWHIGDYPRAIGYYQESLEIRRAIGAKGPLALAMRHLGDLLSVTGKSAQGLAYCQESLAISQEIKAPADVGMSYQKMGKVLVRMGSMTEARDAHERSLPLLADQPQNQVEVKAGLIEIAIAEGSVPQQREMLEEILTYLDSNPAGINEPGYVYLICYQALTTLRDPRASAILKRAYTLIEERARLIDEPRLQQLYRENIQSHRIVLALAANLLVSD